MHAGIGIAAAVHARHQRALGWALSRSLAPNSVTGISVMLGLCAAAWFTAGTRADDVWGALVLCGSYLARYAARQLSAAPGMAAGTAAVSPGLLARVCSAAAECGVYAGLAIGGEAAGWSGMWVLAVTAMILVAVHQTMSDCGGAEDGDPGVLRRVMSSLVSLSAGGRVLIIALAAPVWGTRTALLGVLVWAIIAVGYAIGGYRPGDPAGGESPAMAGESAGQQNAAAGQAEPAGLTALLELATPVPLATQVPQAAPVSQAAQAPAELTVPSGPAATLAPCLLTTITACRDDGRFARYLGRLVRGNLIPLPAAVAGLAAASMLALLGLRNLPGIIVLTPLVVMLLAAPGSGHPHDGRFDWLVPAVLQAGQYVYIATLGFASGVASPVVFALCAMTATRYADLGYRARNPQHAAAGGLAGVGRRLRRIDIGMGWEGRMLIAGLGAIAGIATFAYVALTAYLGVLICSEVMSGFLATGEDYRA